MAALFRLNRYNASASVRPNSCCLGSAIAPASQLEYRHLRRQTMSNRGGRPQEAFGEHKASTGGSRGRPGQINSSTRLAIVARDRGNNSRTALRSLMPSTSPTCSSSAPRP